MNKHQIAGRRLFRWKDSKNYSHYTPYRPKNNPYVEWIRIEDCESAIEKATENLESQLAIARAKIMTRATASEQKKLPHDWNKDLPVVTHMTPPEDKLPDMEGK